MARSSMFAEKSATARSSLFVARARVDDNPVAVGLRAHDDRARAMREAELLCVSHSDVWVDEEPFDRFCNFRAAFFRTPAGLDYRACINTRTLGEWETMNHRCVLLHGWEERACRIPVKFLAGRYRDVAAFTIACSNTMSSLSSVPVPSRYGEVVELMEGRQEFKNEKARAAFGRGAFGVAVCMELDLSSSTASKHITTWRFQAQKSSP